MGIPRQLRRRLEPGDPAQRGGTPPRWHVDIETDDIPAEVARLEALGATRHEDMGSFWQMLDPVGLVFCVVGIQTGDAFERYAATWP